MGHVDLEPLGGTLTNALDPKRIAIGRYIMEARKLAIDIDAQILEFLLESALHEATGMMRRRARLC